VFNSVIFLKEIYKNYIHHANAPSTVKFFDVNAKHFMIVCNCHDGVMYIECQ